MAKESVKILQGKLDVKSLIDQLNAALSEEWLAYYQYWVGALVVEGAMRTGVQSEFEEHAEEERQHAQLLVLVHPVRAESAMAAAIAEKITFFIGRSLSVIQFTHVGNFVAVDLFSSACLSIRVRDQPGVTVNLRLTVCDDSASVGSFNGLIRRASGDREG